MNPDKAPKPAFPPRIDAVMFNDGTVEAEAVETKHPIPPYERYLSVEEHNALLAEAVREAKAEGRLQVLESIAKMLSQPEQYEHYQIHDWVKSRATFEREKASEARASNEGGEK